jgi:hypothetical protein
VLADRLRLERHLAIMGIERQRAVIRQTVLLLVPLR